MKIRFPDIAEPKLFDEDQPHCGDAQDHIESAGVKILAHRTEALQWRRIVVGHREYEGSPEQNINLRRHRRD